MESLSHFIKGFSCLIVLLLMSISPIYANSKTVIFVSDEIDILAENDGQGLYWDIMRAVFELEGYFIKINIVPFARAINIVKTNNADALLNARLGEIEGLIYPEMHYSTAFVSVLCDQENFKEWKGEYSLAYKKVGSIRKYNYHDYLYMPVELYELRSRLSGIKMVLTDRLDCFLDSKFEMIKTLDRYKSEGNKIDVTNRFMVKDIYTIRQYVGFANTKKGRELAKIFDRRIKVLLVSGELKALFDRWGYRPFPFY
jgi:polar amino acid transport system substrate-binding protein